MSCRHAYIPHASCETLLLHQCFLHYLFTPLRILLFRRDPRPPWSSGHCKTEGSLLETTRRSIVYYRIHVDNMQGECRGMEPLPLQSRYTVRSDILYNSAYDCQKGLLLSTLLPCRNAKKQYV
jgi:hypothetical protein